MLSSLCAEPLGQVARTLRGYDGGMERFGKIRAAPRVRHGAHTLDLRCTAHERGLTMRCDRRAKVSMKG